MHYKGQAEAISIQPVHFKTAPERHFIKNICPPYDKVIFLICVYLGGSPEAVPQDSGCWLTPFLNYQFSGNCLFSTAHKINPLSPSGCVMQTLIQQQYLYTGE
ncbi:hypothetical protein FKM82_029143 [Ascaphus truei]